ncbi:hypothetical protein K7472_20605 [Streptomyces sp. PTM05]|uniref:Uncharacterized protein n=1 Tax=Streptantibioticus parmotrematis TaxID=2873249 RepID=A0ABS7QVI4_9ACTN|nr:hypothetical protein [Streptantibioticus parmotrematis]MBY8887230.1 hypothetical protein [Streptantibioticus parmotrematis]
MRAFHPRHPPKTATAAAIRTHLESKGWTLATVGGRECRLNEAPESGHFTVQDEDHDGTPAVILICFTDEYVYDLYSMVEQLKEAGYASESLPFADARLIRVATSQEIADRAVHQTRRVASVLAAILPERPRQPNELPPLPDALF